jgi:hypothetical protein
MECWLAVIDWASFLEIGRFKHDNSGVIGDTEVKKNILIVKDRKVNYT